MKTAEEVRMEQIDLVEAVAGAVSGDMIDNYSGRHMYGATCYAIICADPDQAISEAGAVGLPVPKVDNMGRQFVAYWPGLQGQAA